MGDLEAVRRGIHEHVQGITAELQGKAASQPWLALPQGYTLDNLPDLIMALANEALAEDAEAHVVKVWTAVGHGQDRAEAGFPETLLFNEYHLLRMAVWDFVQGRFPPDDAFSAITRIDAAITQATSASLLGYHRVALEKRGDWPGAVERLIANLTAM